MSNSLSKTARIHFFTMVELMAVIMITGTLLTATMRIIKVDSTKANATTLGGSLSYAQSYALSKLEDDQYIVVLLKQGAKKLSIFKVDTVTRATELIEEKKLTGDSDLSKVKGTDVTEFIIAFSKTGAPFDKLPEGWKNFDSMTTFLAGTVDDTDELKEILPIEIQDNSNSENAISVYIRPFTGKITYY